MSTTVHDIIDDFRTLPVSARERGERFERLMAEYLRLDPIYADRYSEVWMWSDWPGRDGKGDTGIDLVARERDGNGYCAIQCKFYAPEHHLQKADIDSFFTASGKHPFTSRIIISTTDRWGSNAEAALERQQIPVSRVGLAEIAQAPIDWDLAWPSQNIELQLRRHGVKQLRPHQLEAVTDVLAGLAEHDRGKLVMACGTGKTFTSLKIAEQVAEQRGGSARVLFLVPSIALLSQTLREWTANCVLDLRSFPVCSDVKVGRTSEDIGAHDLAVPATTDTTRLVANIAAAGSPTGLTVIFATYQSIDVVARAQEQGLGDFDLVICDEAHRTTGVTLADTDESSFVRVHDNAVIRAAKRLYMTATPRIFGDAAKTKARDAAAAVASMDDEAVFGPEFHHLGFGTAVGRGLLTDYKVLILTVDERYIARSLQSQVADANNEINLDDAVKIVGCWNGLAKHAGRSAEGSGFPTADVVPMARAVAFSHSIAASQKLTDRFNEVIGAYDEADENLLRCEVDHVDGTQNALVRNQKLDWLRADAGRNVCRILSNARCLSEGVDVPGLDAVLFLSPRNSIVDVVQSVGRVMRRAEGKEYGYIILPVGIPAGMEPSQALADNKRYKVVWDVLRALRSHDDRFDATINKLDVNRDRPDNIMVGQVGDGDGDGDAERDAASQLTLFTVDDWRDAIYARIVTKVGERTYWEDWATDVARIAQRHNDRISVLLDGADARVRAAFDDFLLGLRNNLNDGIDRAAAIDMLAQHLVTRPVFDALFADYDFAAHNPVSQVMQAMLDALDDQALSKENEALEGFYASVRLRAEGIDNAEGKQRIIAELYERFFKLAFAKTAESLGIVYTPVEIVDFILRAVDDVLRTELGATLSDPGVHVLDPFTGTGTFVTRMLQSGLVRPDDLARKYASELHANEILLLAYYIAAINIEATYHGLAGGEYEPFRGIVLTDTFQIHEDGDAMDELMFPQNNARVENQKRLDIRVVVGNPPYSVGQSSANDNNANLRYPTLDAAIERTYAARSSATNKNSLYDSYIRAIRWASDRIGDHGVVGYVSNGGWIDSNVADGLRKTLADEFSSVYVFNLRGNQRTAGELSRREGGKVFGGGSRSTVAITLLVKKPAAAGCRVFYRDIGDYLTREQKLAIVGESGLGTIEWETIQPNAAGDWLNQRDDEFHAFPPIGDKPPKGAARQTTVFASYGAGLQTNRDAWVYNFSSPGVRASVQALIDYYNEAVDAFREYCGMHVTAEAKKHVDAFLDPRRDRWSDPQRISWSRSLKTFMAKFERVRIEPKHLTVGAYRPFCKQRIYFDRHLNHERSRMPSMFPTGEYGNVGFYVNGINEFADAAFLMVDTMPCLDLFGRGGYFFPRYTYRPAEAQPTLDDPEPAAGWTRVDNITDAILADYRATYGPHVTKDAIFSYVYGLLHSPQYRTRFAADLKKMLPRIPKVRDFHAFAEAGRALAELHVGYESAAPYPLEEITSGRPTSTDRYRVQQMRFAGTARAKDRTRIVYNAHLTLAGIPEEAYRYQLGSRSGVEWLLDRYRVTTDKASGIVNDPNDWAAEHGDPRYIVDLVKRVVTVSVETMKIVDALPDLDILETA